MTAWVLGLLLSLGVYAEDKGKDGKREQLETLAEAISSATRGDRELARLVVVLGWFESRYSIRIAEGRCYVERGECDRGRARGPWQVWRRRGMSDEAWESMHGTGMEAARAQAGEIVARIRAARKRCKSLESRGLEWPAMVFSSLAGRGCVGDFRGRSERVARFRALGGEQ